MKTKPGAKKYISLASVILVAVLVILTMVYRNSGRSRSETDGQMQRTDKADTATLPPSLGQNPFAGMSCEFRTDRGLARFDFDDGGELFVTEPCTIDSRLSLVLESRCSYSWNVETGELFVKPVACKTDDGYSSSSSRIEDFLTASALEVLDALPYPWYSSEDRRTAQILLGQYFTSMIGSGLFEIQRYGFDIQGSGMMLEKFRDDVFSTPVTLTCPDSEAVIRLSRTQITLSCPPDSSGNTAFYAGLPVFSGSDSRCAAVLCRFVYEDSIQIDRGSRIRLSLTPPSEENGNGIFLVNAKVLEIPEEAALPEGSEIIGRTRESGDLLWYKATLKD